MSGRLRSWMVPLLLLGTVAYAVAEELTLTTYYPSPRGVYNELRTAGNVQIGLLNPPPVGLPGPPRLHLVQGAGAAGDVVPAALRVDDEAPVGTILDATPFLIDANGKVGIGTASPLSALHVVSGQIFLTPTMAIGSALEVNQLGTSGIAAIWLSSARS